MVDYIGDSLGSVLSVAKTEVDIIIVLPVLWQNCCKIINPSKKVLLPDLKAGCSLADSAPAPLFRKFKESILTIS